MKVQDIMTTPVFSVAPSTPIGDAAQLMLAHHISGLPVVDASGALVGVVTEGDFLERSELGTEHKRSPWLKFFLSAGKAADEYVQTHGRRVEDVMTKDKVPTLSVDATMREAIVLLAEQRGIVILLENERLAGVLTAGDLTRLMERVEDPLRVPVRDVMTTSAKVATLGELGSAVVYRMERHRVMAMPVVDGDRHVHGVIHLHDLMRAGVA